MTSAAKFARISAAAGGLVWCVTLFISTGDSAETELIQKIFLLAVFVIVPLGIALISPEQDWIALRYASWFQPVAALLCFTSFLLPQGFIAGILASFWLATISLIALAGLLRILLSAPRLSLELSVNFSMLYLPIGGAWLVASRLGIQPVGFGDTIVLLTAVHFHFAGFAAPVLAGLAGRTVPAGTRQARAVGVASGGIVLGTPLVAAGITFSPTLTLAGALIVTIGLGLLAALVIAAVVPKLHSRVAQVLLWIASISSLGAMVLACLYAYSIVTHTLIIDIPHMAMTHGLLNSFGFALCGLLAWTVNELG